MLTKSQERKRRAGAPKGNKNAVGNCGGGRRPVYSDKLLPIVEGMASDGATDFEIASRLGISKETLRWWRYEHIEFAHAMRLGREIMVARVKESLYHRAVGYSFNSEKLFSSKGRVVRVKIVEHIPPDIAAARTILQAYDAEDVWREKRDVKGGASFSLSDLVALSMKDREERARLAAEGKVIEAMPVQPKVD